MEDGARGKRILETERLTLREFTQDDGELMLEILNDPGFIRFVADRNVRTTREAADYLRDKILPSYSERGFGFYVVELKENGTPIGMCGLIKRDALEHVDVGFSIFERFWGKGYATEAARAVMEFGLTTLRLPKIVGITKADNVRSAAVLEKLGLHFERMVEVPGFPDGSRLFS
jgi:RimJ/RimL family protein N-acetyltransferase